MSVDSREHDIFTEIKIAIAILSQFFHNENLDSSKDHPQVTADKNDSFPFSIFNNKRSRSLTDMDSLCNLNLQEKKKKRGWGWILFFLFFEKKKSKNGRKTNRIDIAHHHHTSSGTSHIRDSNTNSKISERSLLVKERMDFAFQDLGTGGPNTNNQQQPNQQKASHTFFFSRKQNKRKKKQKNKKKKQQTKNTKTKQKWSPILVWINSAFFV